MFRSAVMVCCSAVVLVGCKSPAKRLEDSLWERDEAAVSAAVKAGAAIDTPLPTHDGSSALCATLRTRHPDDPPTERALGQRSQHFIVHLLESGADPNQVCANASGDRVVHMAAGADLVDVLTSLQTRHADLNAVNTAGEGALYRAACLGALNAVIFLHKAGVSDVGARNSDGSRTNAVSCARFKAPHETNPKTKAAFEQIIQVLTTK
jgi:hypothetical protein